MFSKTLGTLLLTASLSTPLMAQVVETPPSQTIWGYVNEEEKERFEQITAPFVSGEIGPMDPSNYTNPKECEKDAQFLEWLYSWREDPLTYDTVAWRNMYQYVRAMNVLEKRDCSCATRNPPSDPAVDLVNTEPVSKRTGNIINTRFFYKLTNKAVDLAEAFCGGQL